jgi:hypothetical protein
MYGNHIKHTIGSYLNLMYTIYCSIDQIMTTLEAVFGLKQVDAPVEAYHRGILQTKDYDTFLILSDLGETIHTFVGAKLANKCLPGDHVYWKDNKCNLELRDEHPKIVGTIELTGSVTYGFTSRGVPLYLFTPYNASYPSFIVGSSEKDKSSNIIALISLEGWASHTMFPRGNIIQVLGRSGEFKAERAALIWQASPWKYPSHGYIPYRKNDNRVRRKLTGYTFNIDPPGCKDIDDILTFEAIDETKWLVTITISDVTLYVQDGSEIDIMASLIGQTLYDLEGRVIRPMLPVEYSEKACSLYPGKTNVGVSLQMVWDTKCNELSGIEWFESLCDTDASYTYDSFMMANTPCVTLLADVASYMAGVRLTNSHQWIESVMIFYNKEAGKLLKSSGMGILRRHVAAKSDVLQYYKEIGMEALQKFAYQSAEYCLAEEKETWHYGLSTDAYAHVTSPIRRYADLVNQRILKSIIAGTGERHIVPQNMYDMNARCKAIRRFEKDCLYLDGIINGKNLVDGVIIRKKTEDNEKYVKVYIYVASWDKVITSRYKQISEDMALSADEKMEINTKIGRKVSIKFVYNITRRNWKERIIINLY